MAVCRIALALIQDFIKSLVVFSEVVIDLFFLLIFSGLLLFALKREEIKSVSPLFGVVYIVLLVFNFFAQGGIFGASNYSYYTGLLVIIFLYRGKQLFALLGLLSAAMIVTVAMTYDPRGAKPILSADSDAINFYFVLFLLAFSISFLKTMIENETIRFFRLNDELQARVEEAKALNSELVQQGKALVNAQVHLENEVRQRETVLAKQQQAIETYIINTQQLQQPVMELCNNGEPEKSNDTLEEMLRNSKIELSEVMQRIARALEENQEINRFIIRNEK